MEEPCRWDFCLNISLNLFFYFNDFIGGLNLRKIIWSKWEWIGVDCKDFIINTWLEFEAFELFTKLSRPWTTAHPFRVTHTFGIRDIYELFGVTKYRFCAVAAICRRDFEILEFDFWISREYSPLFLYVYIDIHQRETFIK